MDLERFNITHYVGHKAIEELSRCYRLFALPINAAADENRIQIMSIDFKQQSDYQEKLRSINILEFDINNINPINAFHFATYVGTLSKKKVEYCIKTSIYFQVMLEAVINNVIDNQNLTFKNKWVNYMEANNAEEVDIQNFMDYFNKIYKGVRNPVIHAEQRIGIRNLQIMKFIHVYKYIKKGWFSFVFLLNKEHNLQLNYQQNWKQMCDIHKLPDNIEEQQFPNLGKLTQSLFKKHLDGLNK